MNDKNLSLIRAYADAEITPEQLEELEQMLRVDETAREVFLREHNILSALEDLALEEQGANNANNTVDPQLIPQQSQTASTVSKLKASSWSYALAIVCIVAIAANIFLLQPAGEPEIITITGLSGEVNWTGDGGQVTQALGKGKRLTGGTFELLSANSWIEFEFRDRSKVTLSGQSALTVSERKRKKIHLRQGSLSASVQQQPTGLPMFVHTHAADLEILGTQFNVSAQPETTKLTVNKGQVRLKRATDGKVVNVPAQHEVIASVEDQTHLAPRRRGKEVSNWKSELKSDVVHGKWISNLRTLGMRLKTAVRNGEMNSREAEIQYKKAAKFANDQGSVWSSPSPKAAMLVLSVSRETATPVILAREATVKIQGRLHSASEVEFGVTVNQIDGGYAGKYSVSISAKDLVGDSNEFAIELPLSDLRPIDSKFTDSCIGKELVQWWCVLKNDPVTKAKAGKLEITRVELTK